ncbi:MAG: hypothetical protein II956_02660 [Bacteroidales bacterium]|nr:hypothetical protein [Bacteroidales bacterium]
MEKTTNNKSKKTIWTYYLKGLIPLVIVFVVLIFVMMFYSVISAAKKNTSASIHQTINIQADNISNIFYRYADDLNVLSKSYDIKNPEKIFTAYRNMLSSHYNKWAFLQVTLPSGISYTDLAGMEKESAQTRKFFREIISEKKQISFEMAHKSEVYKTEVFSISIPVKNMGSDTVSAILTANFPASVIDAELKDMRINEKGFCCFVDPEYNLRMYYVNKILTIPMQYLVSNGFTGIEQAMEKGFHIDGLHCAKPGEVKRMTGTNHYYNPQKEEMLIFYSMVAGLNWALTLNIAKSEIEKNMYTTVYIIIIVSAVLILVLLFVLYIITKKRIIRPLAKVNKFTKDFTFGRLYSSAINEINSDDEIMVLRNNLQQMQKQVHDAVKEIREYSGEISKSSSVMKNSIGAIAEDARSQSATVQEISAAVETIADSIRDNTEKAVNTHVNSQGIASDIQTVTEASENTLICIKNVIEKIKIIDEITTRTDLLAINAAVEAARAGENGKGFSVVATEIRKLAESCLKASTEINISSAQSLQITSHAVELIDKISPKIQEAAEKISEISDTCTDQMSKTLVIKNAINHLVTITQNNSESAEDLAHFADRISGKIEDLNKSIGFFRLKSNLTNEEDREIIDLIEMHSGEITKLKNRLIAKR